MVVLGASVPRSVVRLSVFAAGVELRMCDKRGGAAYLRALLCPRSASRRHIASNHLGVPDIVRYVVLALAPVAILP